MLWIDFLLVQKLKDVHVDGKPLSTSAVSYVAEWTNNTNEKKQMKYNIVHIHTQTQTHWICYICFTIDLNGEKKYKIF